MCSNFLLFIFLYGSCLGFPQYFLPTMKTGIREVNSDPVTKFKGPINLTSRASGLESSANILRRSVDSKSSGGVDRIPCSVSNLFSILDEYSNDDGPILSDYPSRKRAVKVDIHEKVTEEQIHTKCHAKLYKFVYDSPKNDSNQNKTEFPGFLLNLASKIAKRTEDVNKLVYKEHFGNLNKTLKKQQFSNLDLVIRNVSESSALLRRTSLSFRAIPEKLETTSKILHDIFKYIRFLAKSKMKDPDFQKTFEKLKKSALAIDRSYETIRQLSLKIAILSEKLFYQGRLVRSLVRNYIENRLDPNFLLVQLYDILSDFITLQNEITALLNDQKKIFHYLNVQIEILQKYAKEFEATLRADDEELYDYFNVIVDLIQGIKQTPLPSLKLTRIKQYHFHDFINIHKDEKYKTLPKTFQDKDGKSLLSNPHLRACIRYLDKEKPCKNISTFVDCIYGVEPTDDGRSLTTLTTETKKSETESFFDTSYRETQSKLSTAITEGTTAVSTNFSSQIYSTSSTHKIDTTKIKSTTLSDIEGRNFLKDTFESTLGIVYKTESPLFPDYNLQPLFPEDKDLIDSFISDDKLSSSKEFTTIITLPSDITSDSVPENLTGGAFEPDNFPGSVAPKEFFNMGDTTEKLVFPHAKDLLQETDSVPEILNFTVSTTFVTDRNTENDVIITTQKDNETLIISESTTTNKSSETISELTTGKEMIGVTEKESSSHISTANTSETMYELTTEKMALVSEQESISQTSEKISTVITGESEKTELSTEGLTKVAVQESSYTSKGASREITSVSEKISELPAEVMTKVTVHESSSETSNGTSTKITSEKIRGLTTEVTEQESKSHTSEKINTEITSEKIQKLTTEEMTGVTEQGSSSHPSKETSLKMSEHTIEMTDVTVTSSSHTSSTSIEDSGEGKKISDYTTKGLEEVTVQESSSHTSKETKTETSTEKILVTTEEMTKLSEQISGRFVSKEAQPEIISGSKLELTTEEKTGIPKQESTSHISTSIKMEDSGRVVSNLTTEVETTVTVSKVSTSVSTGAKLEDNEVTEGQETPSLHSKESIIHVVGVSATTEMAAETDERFIDIEGKKVSECTLLNILQKYYSSLCMKKKKSQTLDVVPIDKDPKINLIRQSTTAPVTSEITTTTTGEKTTVIREGLFQPLFTPGSVIQGRMNFMDDDYFMYDDEFWPYHKLHRLNRDYSDSDLGRIRRKKMDYESDMLPELGNINYTPAKPLSKYQLDKIYGDVYFDESTPLLRSKIGKGESNEEYKKIKNHRYFNLPFGRRPQGEDINLDEPKKYLENKLKDNSNDIYEILEEFQNKYRKSQIKPVIYRHFKAHDDVKCDKSEAVLLNCEITVHHSKKKVSTDWSLRLICGCQMPEYVGECPLKLQEGIDNIINFCSLITDNNY